MTKSDLIAALVAKENLTDKQATETIDLVLILYSLESGLCRSMHKHQEWPQT